jgi:hypothetical protein
MTCAVVILALFIVALLCIQAVQKLHEPQQSQSQQQQLHSGHQYYQLVHDNNHEAEGVIITSSSEEAESDTPWRRDDLSNNASRNNIISVKTYERRHRHLLNIFNTDNNPCNIEPPPPRDPNSTPPPPTYFATFPGSGAKLTRALLKALTHHRVFDESELGQRRTGNVIIVQTRYPHKSGNLVSTEWDDTIHKCIILIRNPMQAVTNLFDELYARKKHLPIRFQGGVNNNNRRYKDGGATIQDWISWRDRMFTSQLYQFQEFIRYWMKRYGDTERIIISYEDLTIDDDDDDVSEEGGVNTEVVRLVQFLRRIRDLNVVDLENVECIWRTVVNNNNGGDGVNDENHNDEEGIVVRQRRQLSSYIIPHPSSIGAVLAQRPFTVEQLRAMVTMLQELAFEFQNNSVLYGKLIKYHREVMDLATYMTTLESNENDLQQQNGQLQQNEQLSPPMGSNTASETILSPPGTTLDGRTFHIFTSSPPRSDSAFLTNWMMGLFGSGTVDYAKLVTNPSLDVIQNGQSISIDTTVVTHTNEIDLISIYKIFKPSFDEVFFIVSSGLDSEVCEYSNVLCIKYEEQLFTNDEHLIFLVKSLTERFQEKFAYFFGPQANLSIKLDIELAVARLRNMAVAEKEMELTSYETIHPKYGVRGKSKVSADALTNPITDNNSRRLFYCGSYVINVTPKRRERRDSFMGIFLVNAFLPEIHGCAPGSDGCSDAAIKLSQDTLATATSNDFLVYQMHQYCEVDVLTFPGMQLHLNSEYYDLHPRHGLNVNGQYTFDYLPPKDNIFVMGPHADGPRSIKLPYMIMKWWTLVKGAKAEHYKSTFDSLFLPSARPKNSRKHFLLYANSRFVDYREKAANALSSIAPIHALGSCQGNIEAVPHEVDTKLPQCIPFDDNNRPPSVIKLISPNSMTTRDKPIFSEYRYVIAMENVKSPGYITEKILDAFMSGAIPIYYGTTQIFDIFNPKAFIFYDIDNPQKALDRIAYLESNPDAYSEMLNEPILSHGDETIEKYFSFEDWIGNGAFKRKVREKLGFPL